MFSWQHGPHRQGLGALLEWSLEPLFRWNSRTESFVVGGVIVVAAVCALILKRRLYGRLSYSDVVIPIIFLTPLQYETLFITANFAHGPLPLLLVVLYCLAWTCPSPLLRYIVVLTINFATIYTGFGLLLGPLTPVLLAIDYWVNLRSSRNSWGYSGTAVLLSLVSLGSFFIGYRADSAVDCFSPQMQSPVNYARYVALMFAPLLGARGGGPLQMLVGGTVACILLITLSVGALGVLRIRGAQWTKQLVISILAAYCLLFCLGTAYGRICLGFGSAQAPRYVIYLNLGLLGIYFFLLTIPNAIVRHAIVVVAALLLLLASQPSPRLLYSMAAEHDVKAVWRNCYLSFGDVERCNMYSKVYPWEPERTHLQEKLDFLKRTRQNLFTGQE